jgi:hypothetical protein
LSSSSAAQPELSHWFSGAGKAIRMSGFGASGLADLTRSKEDDRINEARLLWSEIHT